MSIWIGFLRGINVGGRNILPMKELKRLLGGLGCEHVATYIQSGNVVFRHAESRSNLIELKIREAVKSAFGFEPHILLLRPERLNTAIARNPFPDATQKPKTLHLYFLSEKVPAFDRNRLNGLKGENEEFRLIDRVFYLHAPDGIGRSKLASKVEKILGVPATARNWTSVEKVMQLVQSSAYTV
jgi:uncharacterized protein (DUF1697 family)